MPRALPVGLHKPCLFVQRKIVLIFLKKYINIYLEFDGAGKVLGAHFAGLAKAAGKKPAGPQMDSRRFSYLREYHGNE
jgi:hypothetical protein